MAPIKVSAPIKGEPEKFESELQKEIYQKLKSLEIGYERVVNDPAVTMEECKYIDDAFGISTIKTLLLNNRQKTNFYLLCMPAEKPFITKDFGAELGISRVSFADSDTLYQLLQTPRGAATPLSLIIDKEHTVNFVIDKELLNRDKLVCTDGTLHGFMALSTKDLVEKYIPACGHETKIISLA